MLSRGGEAPRAPAYGKVSRPGLSRQGPRDGVKRSHLPHVHGPKGQGAVGGSRLQATCESISVKRQDRQVHRERKQVVVAKDPGRGWGDFFVGAGFPFGVMECSGVG